MRRAAVVLVVILVVTACGGEDLEGEAEAYVERIEAISDAVFEQVDPIFDAVFAGDPDIAAILPQYAVAQRDAIEIERDAIAELRAIDAPALYADDHAGLITFLEDRIVNREGLIAAAAVNDLGAIDRLNREGNALVRHVMEGIDPDLGRRLRLATQPEVLVELFADTDESVSIYLDEVEAAQSRFAERNDDFSATLRQTYASSDQLLAALAAAGAGEAFLPVQQAALAIDPPMGWEDDHDRYLAYLVDVVALDAEIGDAALAGDIVAFQVANFGLDQAARRLAVAVEPGLAAILHSDLAALAIGSVEVPPGDYPQRAFVVLRQHRLLTFGVVALTIDETLLTDAELAAGAEAILSAILALHESTRADLSALSPPDQFSAGHDVVVFYLDGLIEQVSAELVSARAGNGTAFRPPYPPDDGGAFCDAAAAVAGTPYEPIAAVAFAPIEFISGPSDICS